jgi:predicted nuclease of predicted toxin-antitoxin system
LGAAADLAVWDYAREQGFAIVSKDSDFAERSVLESGPPKVIWIRLGNCSSLEIEKRLRSSEEIVRSFIEKDEETCLIPGRKQDGILDAMSCFALRKITVFRQGGHGSG